MDVSCRDFSGQSLGEHWGCLGSRITHKNLINNILKLAEAASGDVAKEEQAVAGPD